MMRYAITFYLIFFWGCAGVPEKQVLQDHDYEAWQRDLAFRITSEPDDMNLVEKHLEVAIINADFTAALLSIATLRKASHGDQKQLALTEINVLRSAFILDNCLAKIDAFIAKYPKDKTSAALKQLRPIIVQSKLLPTPLATSLYQHSPVKPYVFARAMQAPEVAYFQTSEDFLYIDLTTDKGVDTNYWRNTTGEQYLTSETNTIDILHYLRDADGTLLQSQFLFKQKANSVLYHADSSIESLDILRAQDCALPALAPWLDFMVASCQQDGQYDLVLFTKTVDGWQRTANLDTLNTAYDETQPQISADGRYLFFASNGLPGYGAADNYYSQILYDKVCIAKDCRQSVTFAPAKNLGPRINTFHDEKFALQISAESKDILVSAVGKHGLLAKVADTTGLPQATHTVSYRFIAYDGQTPAATKIEIVPQSLDLRKQLALTSGQSSDWIRLLRGAKYIVSFSTASGVKLSYGLIVPTDQKTLPNFAIDRFTLKTSHDAITAHYAVDASGIHADLSKAIDRVIERLRSNSELHVLIEGHTDNIGGDFYNDPLSQKRAEVVRREIITRGIPARRITARGWGSRRPLNTNATIAERAANRRIEIHLVRQ